MLLNYLSTTLTNYLIQMEINTDVKFVTIFRVPATLRAQLSHFMPEAEETLEQSPSAQLLYLTFRSFIYPLHDYNVSLLVDNHLSVYLLPQKECNMDATNILIRLTSVEL